MPPDGPHPDMYTSCVCAGGPLHALYGLGWLASVLLVLPKVWLLLSAQYWSRKCTGCYTLMIPTGYLQSVLTQPICCTGINIMIALFDVRISLHCDITI